MTGEEWMADFCQTNGIAWQKLTKGQQFQLGMRIPCNIRCFRVGGPVDVEPGKPCPECGQRQPTKTRYDHINNGGAVE